MDSNQTLSWLILHKGLTESFIKAAQTGADRTVSVFSRNVATMAHIKLYQELIGIEESPRWIYFKRITSRRHLFKPDVDKHI